MAEPRRRPSNARLLHELVLLGTGAAAATMRPLSGAIGAAADAGAERVEAAVQLVLSSDAAMRLVDDFFDAGLFDELVDRLLSSAVLWRLVDEIAQSPSVTAAISGQGLGFAEEVGGELRTRTRRADRWLEEVARRVGRGRRTESAEDGGGGAVPGSSISGDDRAARAGQPTDGRTSGA